MLKELIGIMEDDMNDSYMLYEYLKQAKEDDDEAMTQFFFNRVKYRLANFKEDKSMVKGITAKEEVEWDNVGKILFSNMEDKMNKLEYQVARLMGTK